MMFPLRVENLVRFIYLRMMLIYRCIKSSVDYSLLNKCCKNIFAWSKNWFMKLNIQDCKILSLCNSRGSIVHYDYGFDVPTGGFISLNNENSMKDLGVVMDSHLSFEKRIFDKINMANKMLGII